MKVKNGVKQIWIWVFLALFIVSGARLFLGDVGDYRIYYKSVGHSLDGFPERAYSTERDRFVYMPFAYLLMHPMGWFPLKLSRLMHHLVESALLLLSCFMFLKLALPEQRYLPYLMGFTLILISRFIHNNYGYGQMNLVILFFIIAGIYFFHKNNFVPSALFLACAVSFKLTPLILILYFLVKKEFRLVFYTAAGVLFLNFVIPLLFWGFDTGWVVYRAWFGAQFHIGGVQAAKYSNYSFLAMLFRYLTQYSWGDKGGSVPANLLSLSKSAVLAVYSISVVAALAAFLWRCKGSLKKLEHYPGGSLFRTMLPEYSVAIIIMLMFSPVSWQHHFVLLFIPYFYITLWLLEKGIEKNRLVFRLVLVSFVLSSLTAPAFLGIGLSRTLMNFSVLTTGAIVLLAAVIRAGSITEKKD